MPFAIRWPGKIKAGSESDEIVHELDLFPTLARIAGGEVPSDRVIDGMDMSEFFLGRKADSGRDGFVVYMGNDIFGVKWRDWKLHFTLVEGDITTAYRRSPAWPRVVNLRADPFEKAMEESVLYMRWMADNMWLFVPAQDYIGQFLMTFQDFPPRRGSSLSVNEVLQQILTQGPSVGR